MATEPLPPNFEDTQNYSSIIEPPTQHPSPPVKNVPESVVEATERGMMGENLLNDSALASPPSFAPLPPSQHTTAHPLPPHHASSSSAGMGNGGLHGSDSVAATPLSSRSREGSLNGASGRVLPGVTPSRAEEALLVGGVPAKTAGDATGGAKESGAVGGERGSLGESKRHIKWKGLDA